MPDNDILIKIRADIKDIKAKLKNIEADFKGTSRGVQSETNRMNSGFANLKKIIIGAFSIAVLYKFKQGIQDCVKAASNLEEQTAKFGTVFGNQIDKASESVEILTELYGMSTREAREHMAAVQDLLVPMGMMRDEAANLSFEIVKLATDLGSFNNLPTKYVMNSIESALTGQYRTMRQYGIVLFDTEVRQRALNMGLAKTNDELTAGDRALAAYRMMMEDSKDATGDFIRTSDSYANTLKSLNAQIEEFQGTIGIKLLPVLANWMGDLNTLIGDVTRFAKNIGLTKDPLDVLIQKQAELVKSIEWDTQALGENNRIVERNKERLREVKEEIKNLLDMRRREIDLIREETDETENLTDKVTELTEEQEKQIQSLLDLAKAQLEMPEFKIPTLFEVGVELKELLPPAEPLEYNVDLWKALQEEARLYFETLEDIPQYLLDKANEKLNDMNDSLSKGEYYADQMGNAVGDALGKMIKGGAKAEDIFKDVLSIMIQIIARSMGLDSIGGLVSGLFGGLIGAPAPESYQKNIVTVGQVKEATTLSKPLFGTRYRQELLTQGLNIESISSWEL